MKAITASVRPPRAMFVPFPFGSPLGRANDPEIQRAILRAALALLEDPALEATAIVDYRET